MKALNVRHVLNFPVPVICMRRDGVGCFGGTLRRGEIQRKACAQRRLRVIKEKNAGDHRNRKGRAGQHHRHSDPGSPFGILLHARELSDS